MPSRPADPARTSAVAIAYDPADSAPRVVAKGYGTLAETIIQTAKEHELYIHESPELVELLMQVDLDAHIPPQLYVAIAELLAWLYELDAIEGGAARKPTAQAERHVSSSRTARPTAPQPKAPQPKTRDDQR